MASTTAPRGGQDATLRPATAGRSLRLALGVVADALGAPRDGGGISYVEFTPDGLLRHVVYLGEREDKPVRDVVREPTFTKSSIIG